MHYAKPLVGNELHKAVASYLCSFFDNSVEREQGRKYLNNNGLVRILVKNNALLKKVKEVV